MSDFQLLCPLDFHDFVFISLQLILSVSFFKEVVLEDHCLDWVRPMFFELLLFRILSEQFVSLVSHFIPEYLYVYKVEEVFMFLVVPSVKIFVLEHYWTDMVCPKFSQPFDDWNFRNTVGMLFQLWWQKVKFDAWKMDNVFEGVVRYMCFFQRLLLGLGQSTAHITLHFLEVSWKEPRLIFLIFVPRKRIFERNTKDVFTCVSHRRCLSEKQLVRCCRFVTSWVNRFPSMEGTEMVWLILSFQTALIGISQFFETFTLIFCHKPSSGKHFLS